MFGARFGGRLLAMKCIFLVDCVSKDHDAGFIVNHCDARLFIGMEIAHKDDLCPASLFGVGVACDYEICLIFLCDHCDGYMLFLVKAGSWLIIIAPPSLNRICGAFRILRV
jgi:hypothetical protein